MKPEIPEFISISAAGIWAHLMLLRLALEYYNVSRQYDVIINRIDAPVFLAALLCVVAFVLHVLARISRRRWGWGLVMNLLLVPLPAWVVYDRAVNILAENPIRWPQQVAREPIAAPSPIPTLVFRWVATEQWTTYTDPVSHFSIQYPSDWELQPPQKDPFGYWEIEMRWPPNPIEDEDIEWTTLIIITVFDNPSRLPLDRWIEEKEIVESEPPSIREGLERELVIVGGQAGEQIVGLPSRLGTLEVFVASGQYVYRFLLTPYDPETDYLAEASRLAADVFYQMLDTVVFETK